MTGTLREWFSRLSGVFRRNPSDADLELELQSHLELARKESREAVVQAGGVAQAMEALRDQRGVPWFENFLRDVRFGCRALARRPAFSIVTIVALTLGLGGTITVFSIANTWFLRPLEARDPDSLVRITGAGGDASTSMASDNQAFIWFTDYLTYRDQNQSFSSLSAGHVVGGLLRVRIDGPPVQVLVTPITSNQLSTLGIPAAMGRTFTADDAKPGAPPVVVLSDVGWRRYFDARPDVVGRSIVVDGQSASIIGVLPSWFTGTNSPTVPQMYQVLPETTGAEVIRMRVHVIGRLKPGVSVEQARADLSRMATQLTARDGEPRRIEVYPARAALPFMARIMSAITLLFGVIVLVVLLVVCDDVAILMTIRAAMRRKEIGVRLALGATRARIVTQLTIETGLLCLVAGVLATYLSYIALQFASRFYAPVPVPIALTIRLEWHVVVFAVIASAAAMLLCGILPILHSLNTDVLSALKDTALSGGVRSGLVITQVALSTVLLVTAVVLMNSLVNAASANRGFVSRGVIMSTIAMGERDYTPQRRLAFIETLLGWLAHAPGVTSAAVVDSVPLAHNAPLQRIELRDGTSLHPAYANLVSAGFFTTLQIDMVAGRDFLRADNTNASHVGIVNETLAKQFWPGQSAVGRRLQEADGSSIDVIGIVRDSKYNSVQEPATAMLYRPMALRPVVNPTFLVRVNADPAAAFGLIRSRVDEIDPELVPYNFMTLDDRLNLGLAINRTAAAVAGAMGALAFALGALGICGTIAFLAQQRRREFGIRVALGATLAQVMGLIIRQGMRWGTYGLLIGLAGAWLVAFGFTRFLPGVSRTDIWAFVLTPLVLLISVYGACYLPARRALTVNPVDTLRSE